MGSSISLGNTFSIYYSLSSLKSKANGSIIIYRAILKYGYSNFSLDILEYCEPNLLIKREQYYIDLLNPEYNIKVASSKIGFKHSEDNISLNTYFVSDLTDEEGCFSVSINVSVNKEDKAKYKRGGLS